MKKALISVVLVAVLTGVSHADSIYTVESGLFPRDVHTAGDACLLSYYDICSGQVLRWTGYNGTEFAKLQGPPAQVGVCFDLTDCQLGCRECQNLDAVTWAWKRFTAYGYIDVQVFCADENCCPVGPPLASIYNYHLDFSTAWQHLVFEGVPLHCPSCKFIVMATILTPLDGVPLSDLNSANIQYGCETEWRCTTHSYCYRNVMDYCVVRQHPGELFVDWEGGCPPDYDRFYAEWLCDAHIGCRGPTATEKNSWSEIKAIYR